MKPLFIIPARGGSKGIPGKNIKLLNGKPLINYSIDFARLFVSDEDICISTDSEEIKKCVSQTGLNVPFMRPTHLASDTSGSYEVLQHAVGFYKNPGKKYDVVILLQPTSPFRKEEHLKQSLELYDDSLDMVVSVKEAKANPYYNLFEENDKGLLRLSKNSSNYNRRQDVPKVYEYNGSIYIINVTSLMTKKSFSEFTAIRKYVMEDKWSVDIDAPDDWEYAEYLIKKQN